MPYKRDSCDLTDETLWTLEGLTELRWECLINEDEAGMIRVGEELRRRGLHDQAQDVFDHVEAIRAEKEYLEDQQRLLRETVEVLLHFGPWAAGDDPEATAQEWRDFGFCPDEVREWLRARCFQPGAALQLQFVQLGPGDASRRVESPVGRYTDTLGYLVSNRDLTAPEALFMLNRIKREDT